jgi:Domain of unknown function (DUF222)
VLELAAVWADRHYLDPDGLGYHPLVERACAFGGEGTPEVSEYCAAELGALQGTGMWAARSLIADALDLRYRLPRLWDRVRTGGVRAWQARKVAEATRCLSWQAASNLDHALSDSIGLMPWPRFRKILDAAVLDADPELAAERAERARTSQDVYSFDSEDGLKTIVAKAAAGDAVWFLAAVNRIADILAARGDSDPVGARRARAVGILARPAEALQLLIEHQHDENPADEPVERDDPADAAVPDDPAAPDDDVDVDHRSLSMAVPAGFDAQAGRPRVVLHFHLSEDALKHGNGMVRPEHGEPVTINQLVEFLASAGCAVRVQPVLDPASTAPIDGYEVSPRLRAAVRYWQVADVFPFGTCTSPGMDLDHTEPYVPTDYGGPPGQTRLDNLGPMARSSHRAVTHGGWQKHQPEPGYFVHRSPCGYIYLVTNQGTLALGRTGFNQAVWNAAQPRREQISAVG